MYIIPMVHKYFCHSPTLSEANNAITLSFAGFGVRTSDVLSLALFYRQVILLYGILEPSGYLFNRCELLNERTLVLNIVLLVSA